MEPGKVAVAATSSHPSKFGSREREFFSVVSPTVQRFNMLQPLWLNQLFFQSLCPKRSGVVIGHVQVTYLSTKLTLDPIDVRTDSGEGVDPSEK